LKKALSKDRDWFEYLMLFEDERGEIFFKQKDIQLNLLDRFDKVQPTKKSLEVKGLDFALKSLPKSNNIGETVFYSPILDYRIYPITHDNNKWIDVSTDYLMYKVYQNESKSKDEISQVDLFRYFEIRTQLNVLRNKKIRDELEKHISIPEELTIVSTGFDLEKNDFKNVPYKLKGIYNKLMETSDDVLRKLEKELREANKDTIEAEKVLGFLLEHVLKSFYWHLNRARIFYQDFNFELTEADFNKSSMLENMILFFRELNRSGYKNDVESFLRYIHGLISTNVCEFHDADSVSFDCGIEDFETLYDFNIKYLSFLRTFTRDFIPISFIDFSWRNISTGEKAFFNIFSRFFYAKDQILERWRNRSSPSVIYILIDEGELGFHLSWQKNYVSTLLNFIPIAFEFEETSPKIQIIFTSHSPMSLSDIPRYNVAYLKKNSEKHAEVLKNEEKPDKTFSANVHSLLIHSFFLSDGLIGDFAKNRINEIIELINSNQLSSEKRDWVIKHIDIIDEPILRAKLKEMFYEKFEKENELRRLELLKEEIESRISKLK
jgi:hypothetical protein